MPPINLEFNKRSVNSEKNKIWIPLIRKPMEKNEDFFSFLREKPSPTREKSIAKLISLGSRVVPQICSYLEKEGAVERKLMRFFELQAKAQQPIYVTFDISKMPREVVIPPISEEELNEIRFLERAISVLSGDASFYGEADEWLGGATLIFGMASPASLRL